MITQLDWIKENAKIFIDQNIPQRLRDRFRKEGYKDVIGVFDIGYVGANDGKLLKLIKEKKYILITFDKHFYKASLKYHNGMAYLAPKNQDNTQYGLHTLFKRSQNHFIHNYKKLKEFYDK